MNSDSEYIAFARQLIADYERRVSSGEMDFVDGQQNILLLRRAIIMLEAEEQ